MVSLLAIDGVWVLGGGAGGVGRMRIGAGGNQVNNGHSYDEVVAVIQSGGQLHSSGSDVTMRKCSPRQLASKLS